MILSLTFSIDPIVGPKDLDPREKVYEKKFFQN